MQSVDRQIPVDSSTPHSLRQYIRPLFARKWIALSIFVLAVAFTYLALRMREPEFKAEALLLMQSPQQPTPAQTNLNLISQQFYMPLTQSLQVHSQLLSSDMTILEIQERLRTEHGMAFAQMEIDGAFSLSSQVNSPLIHLTAFANTPQKAQALANTAAEVYVRTVSEIERTDLNQASSFLQQQMQSVNSKLEAVERAMNRFQADDEAVFIPQLGSSGTQRVNAQDTLSLLQQLEAELAKTEMEISWTDAQLESVREALSGAHQPTVALPPQINQIQSRLINAQLQLDSMRETFTERDPEVIALRRQVDSLQERLDEELAKIQENEKQSLYTSSEVQSLVQQSVSLDLRLQGLRQKRVLLTQRISVFREEHPDLMTEQTEFTSLQRQARVLEQTYMMLLESHEGMLLMERMEKNRLQFIKPAEMPFAPTGPPDRILLLFSGFLGLGLGLGVVLFLEYFDDSIRRKDQVRRLLGIPTLGLIAKSRRFKLPQAVKAKATKEQRQLLGHSLLFAEDSAPVVKDYQILATNIMYADIETPIRSLLVTSALPKEGKTTTVTNLGIAMARAGERVLVVDADLQRSDVRRVFSAVEEESAGKKTSGDRKKGLTELLLEEIDYLDVATLQGAFIYPTSVEKLHILPTGSQEFNSESVLNSPKLRHLLKRLREAYDLVIVDSAPLLVSNEAMILATHTDKTLLVMRSGETRREAALQATELLQNMNADMLGGVLIDCTVQNNAYYYGKRYYARRRAADTKARHGK